MSKIIFLLVLNISLSPLFLNEKRCDFLIWLNKEELWISNYDWSNKNKLSFDKIDAACFSPDGKYIAYVANNNLKIILKIIDYFSKEISSKLIQDKETLDDFSINIRSVEKIFWTENGYLMIDAETGPLGSDLYIFKIDKNFDLLFLRRVSYFHCSESIVSANGNFLSCVYYSYAEDCYYYKNYAPDKIKNLNPQAIIYIYNTNKKRNPADDQYEDLDPIAIKLKDTSFKGYHFSNDGNCLYIEMEGGQFYKYSIEEKQLKEIKQLPKELKIKKVPETIKIKKGKKEIELDVLDMYCEE